MTSAAVRVINNSRGLDEEYHRKLPPAIYIGQHTTTSMWNSLGMIFYILYGPEATHFAQNRNLLTKYNSPGDSTSRKNICRYGR
ncbi:unnamed protein product [Penicillium camemberti]|uniref:Str. FM013 n=1 Tax=Penicillium camemberti (strain FM 013) TaxID=1429867 RepID=A0A0G4NWY6_PENC3|nr:unnamed protein product [Penicillium camemberti]